MSQQLLPQPLTAPIPPPEETFLERLGFRREPVNEPRTVPEFLDLLSGYEWGNRKIQGIELASKAAPMIPEEANPVLRELLDVLRLDIGETYLDPLILNEFGIKRFANTSIIAESENQIPPDQKTMTFASGNFIWTTRRITHKEELDNTPYHVRYGFQKALALGLPFESFWWGEDRFNPAKLPKPTEQREQAIAELARAGLYTDPVILGKFGRQFFLVGRWK